MTSESPLSSVYVADKLSSVPMHQLFVTLGRSKRWVRKVTDSCAFSSGVPKISIDLSYVTAQSHND